MKNANTNLSDKMLAIIQDNPGIRPSELNRRLGVKHSNHYRQKLIERGKVRKERKGATVHYYSTEHVS